MERAEAEAIPEGDRGTAAAPSARRGHDACVSSIIERRDRVKDY